MIWILLTGLLAGLSLPSSFGSIHLPNLGGLAWVSLIPLYLSLRRQISQNPKNQKTSFKYGFLFGVGLYSVSLYWIFIAMYHYGEVPAWGSFLGVAVVVFFLSAYVGAAASLAVFLSQYAPVWVVFPMAWVGQDFVRTYFPFGGFPWSSLGYSQSASIHLLQILDLTGIYGLTFLILLGNVFFGELWLWFQKREKFPKACFVMGVLLFSLSLIYGSYRYHREKTEAAKYPTLKVVLIQGNIAQEDKWIEEKVEEILARHMAMSEEATQDRKPTLILWPEAAYPVVMPPDMKRVRLLNDLTVPLLMGVVSYRGTIPKDWPPSPDDTDFTLYNSAFLISPGGLIEDHYEKIHLVPLGEYVPMGRLLFFLNKIVPSISSFTAGQALNLMSVREHKFGVTICYEDLFPSISRGFTEKGADFLVNLTNDGWYEKSSALYQHFDFSRFRAIENRRSMVRVTNTGITGVFSPTGEVIAEAPLFQQSILTVDVPVGGELSLYTRFGDFFAWGCVVTLGLLLVGKYMWRHHHGE